MRAWCLRRLRPDEFARRDIDAEIEAHLAACVEHLVARGLSHEAARAEAIRRFGDVEAGRAALLGQRRPRLADRLERLGQDVRFVGRSLARNPAFSFGVIATLAIGLGINTAVFRVADNVLHRPPSGVDGAARVRRVEAMTALGGGPSQRATVFSYGDARRLIDCGAFASAAVYTSPRLQRDADGREVATSYIDANYFALLGVPMATGRAFDGREGEPGSAQGVAVASFAYWRRALNGRPFDERAAVVIGERSYRLIGVAARGFAGIDLDPIDVWIPLGDAELGRGTINGVAIPWYRSEMLRALRVIGRIGPAEEEPVVVQKLATAFAAEDAGIGRPARTPVLYPIVPVGDPSRDAEARQLLGRLTGVATLVLVLACANAVNLLLARAVRRAREIGIRVAVGASRWRVARLLLIESLALSAAGGVAATIGGFWTADALRRVIFPDSRWTASAFDNRTIVFTGLIAIAAGLLAGLGPALQPTRVTLVSALKEGRSPGARAGRTRAALIVTQTSLSVALLVAAGLLVWSLVRLNQVDLGFHPEGLLSVSVNRMGVNAAGVDGLADRLAGVPAVHGVALASIAPFGASSMSDITVPGSSFVPESPADLPFNAAVSPSFFEVMGVRVLRGRALLERDVAGSEPVAVVNESMARRYWGPLSPFESCIISPPNPCARVVGVVADVRDSPVGAAPPMRFYVVLAQVGGSPGAVLVRTEPAEVRAVAAAIRALMPPSPPPAIDVIADRVSRALRPWSQATLLFVLLGAVALTLAGVGIYSVMSYIVSERTHEMGVRLALGATGADIVRFVLGRGLRLVGAGCLIGLAAGAASGRFLGTLVYDVTGIQPGIYAVAVGAVTVIALCAILPPAVRASRIDPLNALRME